MTSIQVNPEGNTPCKFSGLDVLIIGAGPAGLTSAYLLTKKSDKRLVVLEANDEYVGGISRTERHDGYMFDIGGHRFFSKSKEVNALWREILPEDLIERPRLSRILYKNKFYSYPLRAFEALANLGVIESTLCVLSYLRVCLFPIKHPSTFHEWVANQFGERLFEIFFKTYTEKVWGISCDELSADWAAQRIKGLNLATAILSAIHKSVGGLGGRVEKDGKVVKTLIESFLYPRNGPGMMWEAAKAAIIARGGQIHMGSTAGNFTWRPDLRMWEVRAERSNGAEVTYLSRHVISSAPLRDVVRAVRPEPRCAREAEKLGYRDFLIVAIMLNTRPAFSDNWIYIHDPKVKAGRVQNFSSWSPEMVPHNGVGCLGLEYFCSEGDALWTTPDGELIEMAIGELEFLGLAARSQVHGGRVVRQPNAYPVYDGDYKAIVDRIKNEFASCYPRMHFVGRNGMHKYNNQDHAMMTAMLTVENILRGKPCYDVWRVNEDAEYHEEGS